MIGRVNEERSRMTFHASLHSGDRRTKDPSNPTVMPEGLANSTTYVLEQLCSSLSSFFFCTLSIVLDLCK